MSWNPLPVSQAQVREFIDVNSTTGQFSDNRIGSNIRSAASAIQREAQRQFEPRSGVTMRFTTDGRDYITIPDTRSVTSVHLQSTELDADSTYHLIPDAMQTGVYTGIQFRAFGQRGNSYKSNPEWFDRNLDHPLYQARSSLPNDLVIVADVGHVPYPDDFLGAVIVLAGFLTRRSSSTLADVVLTPEGNELRYSQWPVEVRQFVESWKGGSQVIVIDG